MVLPPSWRTLYQLTRVPEKKLVAKIADGTINPKTERKDVQALLPPPKKRTSPTQEREAAFPTRVMVDNGEGRPRLATKKEAEEVFAATKVIANPIVSAWERADEDMRSHFVWLFRTEIERILKEVNHG